MIETSESSGIRTLRLAHGKASALDLELVTALDQAVAQAVADKVRAIVLTGSGHIFCAGVDLFRVADGGADYVNRYLPAFTKMVFTLFTADLPVIVAANGHAIAGGAVLVAAGDYRLMAAGDGRFGYTELRVGVPFPPGALEVIRFATPRGVEQMLYGAATYPPQEMLARGALDELVEAPQLIARATEVAEQIAAIPAAAFAATKQRLREPVLERMHAAERASAAAVAAAWASPGTIAGIRAYLERTVRKR
jgi:enoyl-CoA hydratase